jgi:23S rRNA (cytidine1920-2'-O)/16S rRNA (cytidine1409-2'-O)-methyltransferase
MPMAKQRLDQRLVKEGRVKTRSRAQAMIREGKVLVDGLVITKTGHEVDDSQVVVFGEEDHPYVSRGGLKLNHALDHWEIDPKNMRCLDIGSSTGGFTDCLLRRNATHVVAVDVGTNQMDPLLKADKRVVLYEKTHIKNFTLAELKEPVDLLVMDLSFISLKQVFTYVKPLLRQGGICVALLKPQFELGPKSLNARGIVKETNQYQSLCLEMIDFMQSIGFIECKYTESPIAGGDGNKEYFLHGVLAG